MKEGNIMPNETQNGKKEFDPTMSFSFFGSWLETVERLRESQGVEAAYNLFISIANYSMYYDTPILRMVLSLQYSGL